MRIISGYLTRLFVARFLAVLCAMAVLGGLLDVIANADVILHTGSAGVAGLFRFAALRLPEIAAQMTPLSVLLGLMLAFGGLIRHNEMTMIQSAGVSQFRQMAVFLPALVVIAIAQFVVQDQIIPTTTAKLRAWGVGDYRGGSEGSQGTWVRQGSDVIQVRHVAAEGRHIEGVSVFRRDPEGRLTETIEIEAADFAGGAWRLQGVERRAIAEAVDSAAATPAAAAWSLAVEPRLLTALSRRVSEMSLLGIKRVLVEGDYGNRPRYLYQTWWHHKLAVPVGCILMVVLAVPLGQRFRRRGNIAPMLIVGTSLGFLYLIAEGLLLSLGEASLLPPVLAGWAPALLLASIGGSLAFFQE